MSLGNSSRGCSWLAVVALIGGICAAYHNCFSVPFIYDDVPAVVGNSSILKLSSLGDVLRPPPHLTTTGRPLVNLSLAINYAISGTRVGSYHVMNVAIHLGAALALFGIVRRTLLRPAFAARAGKNASLFAFGIAAVWALHPLQTEAVTYVIQRAESLVALFYLLTLYCFIRATDDDATNGSMRRVCWSILSVLCCALGMACKEVMVSAPLVIVLYDRTFGAGTFRESLRRHWAIYSGCATTWLLLAYCVSSTGGTRDGSAGFGQGMAWWVYAVTQARGILLYLRLAIYPYPLIFDYGDATIGLREAMPYMAAMFVLLVGTCVALWRRSAVGFLAVCFFAILAPSSSIVPVVTETLAEHRMYLPLAALIALGGLGACLRWGGGAAVGLLAIAGALGIATERRNVDYQSVVSIWSDAVAKLPTNGRAHNQLASALSANGQEAEAMPHYAEALRLQPNEAKAHFNYATALYRSGRLPEALAAFEDALKLHRDHADTHTNYGRALLDAGRRDLAIVHYRVALKIDPQFAEAYSNLGVALGMGGDLDGAIREFEAALKIRPDYAEAYNNLGFALVQKNRITEAIPRFLAAIDCNPSYAEAHNNLARAYEHEGMMGPAIFHYREVVRLAPNYADGFYALGMALARSGQASDAAAAFEAALRIAPRHEGAQRQLAELRVAHAAVTP